MHVSVHVPVNPARHSAIPACKNAVCQTPYVKTPYVKTPYVKTPYVNNAVISKEASTRRYRSSFCPFPQLLDPFRHNHRKRPGRCRFAQQQLRVERRVVVERCVKRGDDGLFDLGATETARCRGEQTVVEQCGILFTFAQVDAEDFGAGFGVGEIDEEDLVEAAFAQELWRKP